MKYALLFILFFATFRVRAQTGMGERIDVIQNYITGRGYSWERGNVVKGGPLNGWLLVKAHGENQTITYCFNPSGLCLSQYHEFDTELAYKIRLDKTQRSYQYIAENKWANDKAIPGSVITAEKICQNSSTGYFCLFLFSLKPLTP